MPLSTKSLKYLVILYNIVLALSGIAVCLLNCIFLYKFLRYNQFVSINITAPAITLLVIGILSCFFAWVGWKAACTLHRFHIIIFGVLLLLVVLIELGCCIWTLVIWDNLKDEISKAVDVDFLAATEHKQEYAIKRWEKLQKDMQCCGVGGTSDYRLVSTVPWACCAGAAVPIASGNGVAGGDCGTMYQRGCLSPLTQMVEDTLLNICFTALGAGLLQASGLLCTFYLVAALGRPLRTPPRRRAPPAPGSPAEEALVDKPPPNY